MQINPQVNTNIIRSVTLQHCPKGMCEFHLEISQTSDNSANRQPSDFRSPKNLAKNAHVQIKTDHKTNPNPQNKAEPKKTARISEIQLKTRISLKPLKPLRLANVFFSFLQIQLPVGFFFLSLFEWANKKKSWTEFELERLQFNVALKFQKCQRCFTF